MKAAPNIFCNCRNSCYFVCLIRMQNIIKQKLNTPKVKYFSNEKSPAAWWIITLSTIIKITRIPSLDYFVKIWGLITWQILGKTAELPALWLVYYWYSGYLWLFKLHPDTMQSLLQYVLQWRQVSRIFHVWMSEYQKPNSIVAWYLYPVNNLGLRFTFAQGKWRLFNAPVDLGTDEMTCWLKSLH